MLPSILVAQVRRGLENLLRSTLDLSTPAFNGIVDRFVANPEAFIKGPWISIELPFRKADPARGEFFPEIPLDFVPHAHQAKAFDRLAYPNARSTLVATGTGSGKTECFLWPIFDACTKLKGAPGIKAIIIYPMNALAGDQARRIAKAITEIPALSGVRCGIYADSEPRPASAVVTPIEVITSREEMRRNPPDILLTNYKMLDFLLVRSQDRPLWTMNDPTTLRYLVVDEIHTFDGAQGTDLALLVRRLKARLRAPEGHLACVGTSATLGGPGAAEELITYAEDIFGERFDAGAIVTEDRQSVSEYLGAISIDDIRIPDMTALASLLGTIDAMDQAGAVRAIADLILADPPFGEPTSDPWRIALGTKVKGHILFHEVLRTAGGKPARLDTIADELGRRAFLSDVDAAGRAVVVEALAALVSYARAGAPGNTRALLNVRLQLWLRELARMVATAPRRLDSTDPTSALSDLAHSDDLDSAATRRALPLTYCRHCGTGGLLASRPEGTRTSYWATPKSLYEGFFEGSTSLRILYPERVETRGRAGGNSVEGTLCPDCLSIKADACRSDSVCGCGYGSSPGVPIWVYDPPRLAASSGGAGARIDKSCPACGIENALAIAGVRAATEASSLAATLFGSTQSDDPKLLLFSDSVQDAAQRAAVIESRNLAVVLRKALVQHLDVQTRRKTTLADLIANAPTMFRATLGDASFVSTFIPGDMTWMRDFEALILTDALPDRSHLPDNVAYRTGWEIFSETTYRSRTSQTLESGGLAAAAVMPDLVEAIARDVVARWEDKIGTVVSAPSQKAETRFVAGVLDTMRRKGAVAHEYLERAVERANDRGPNWFAARRSLVRSVLPDVMPIPRASSSSSPRLPTTRARLDGFEAVGRDGASNWYRSWADKYFQTRHAFGASIIEDVFALLFECAGKHGVVKRLLVGADPNKPVEALACEAIEVDRNAVHVVCDACGRRHLVPATAAVIWESAPCTKAACQGTFSLDTAEAASVYLDRLLSQGRNKRIVAREHTGILEAADRRRLETRFISGKKDWDPNVISATPTLEMGINIGDLSSILLCSIPPEQANYLQRIGRTGRRDGNSLNLTIANARPHDLLYWVDPEAMIAGSVRPPGVHLEAFAVLKRQIAAFSLDLMVAWSVSPVDYGRMKDAFEAIGGAKTDVFPLTWIAFIEKNAGTITDGFVKLLPDRIVTSTDLAKRIEGFVREDADGLRGTIAATFDDARQQRGHLVDRQRDLDLQIRRVRAASPPPDDLDDRIEALRRDRRIMSALIRKTIDRVDVLRFLTDRGVLPNYAFPEEGVTLQSIVYWRPNKDGVAETRRPQITEYVRPASSALSEFAPTATFYAEGRKSEIDQIDLTRDGIQPWRFCDTCTHMVIEAQVPVGQTNCPSCGSVMWRDNGRIGRMVPLRTVISVTEASHTIIDDKDDRETGLFDRSIFPSYERSAVRAAFALDAKVSAVPFGYEYVANARFRDLNFGHRTDMPVGQEIAGNARQARPFIVCEGCGKVQERWAGQGNHTARCSHLSETDRSVYEREVYLYRTFQSEALRVVLPVIGTASDDDIKSFVAAFAIGMRSHFAGRVDHVRSTVIEEKQAGGATIRSLYLYDTVPGGTGYLGQIAERPEDMHDILRRALGELQICPCNEDPNADGCHRCVKSYRALFGRGTPSRNTGLQLVSVVLAEWHRLEKVDDVGAFIRSGLLESELEERLIDTIRQHVGPDGLVKPYVLPNAAIGYQVRFGADGTRWSIEPQVDVGARFGIAVDTRADFVFTAIGRPETKPIIVYMDGWQFHADRIASDVDKRLAIMRSGKAEAWSLTWDDMDPSKLVDRHYTSLFQDLPPATHLALLKKIAEGSSELPEAFRRNADPLKRLMSRTSLESLMAHLREEPAVPVETVATFLAPGLPKANLNGLRGEGATVLDSIEPLFDGCNKFGWIHRPGYEMIAAITREAVPQNDPAAFRAGDIRLLLIFDPSRTADPKRDWNGLLHALNLLQGVPSLHVAMPGLEDLALPSAVLATAVGIVPSEEALGWIELRDLVDETLHPLIDRFAALSAPLPDGLGVDLMRGDEVVSTLELTWSYCRVAIALGEFDHPDWRIISGTSVLLDPDGFVSLIRVQGIAA